MSEALELPSPTHFADLKLVGYAGREPDYWITN